MKETDAIYKVELMQLKKLIDMNQSWLGLVYASIWGHLRVIPLLCSEEVVNEYREFYTELDAMITASEIIKGLKK